MMKRLFAILLCLPAVCFGSEYNKLKNDSTFSPLMEYKELVKHSLPVIEERVRNIDSKLVDSAKNDTDEQKIVKYNNRLAQKVFDDYKNYFFEDIKIKAKERGLGEPKEARDVNQDNELLTWLDRGELDTEKCNSGRIVKNESDICLYPDGFEEYKIQFINDLTLPSLHVERDDKSKNITEIYDIDMLKQSDDKSNYTIMIDVRKHVCNYQEYFQYRNQIKREEQDGTMTYWEDCSGKECDELEKTWQEEVVDIYAKKPKSEDMQPRCRYVKMGLDKYSSFD